eukprot:m.179604 g.179604  ORF g.179604 m.179604 type:complete len:1659 (-) comp14642_c2_seq2:170-5146(-)
MAHQHQHVTSPSLLQDTMPLVSSSAAAPGDADLAAIAFIHEPAPRPPSDSESECDSVDSTLDSTGGSTTGSLSAQSTSIDNVNDVGVSSESAVLDTTNTNTAIDTMIATTPTRPISVAVEPVDSLAHTTSTTSTLTPSTSNSTPVTPKTPKTLSTNPFRDQSPSPPQSASSRTPYMPSQHAQPLTHPWAPTPSSTTSATGLPGSSPSDQRAKPRFTVVEAPRISSLVSPYNPTIQQLRQQRPVLYNSPYKVTTPPVQRQQQTLQEQELEAAKQAALHNGASVVAATMCDPVDEDAHHLSNVDALYSLALQLSAAIHELEAPADYVPTSSYMEDGDPSSLSQLLEDAPIAEQIYRVVDTLPDSMRELNGDRKQFPQIGDLVEHDASYISDPSYVIVRWRMEPLVLPRAVLLQLSETELQTIARLAYFRHTKHTSTEDDPILGDLVLDRTDCQPKPVPDQMSAVLFRGKLVRIPTAYLCVLLKEVPASPLPPQESVRVQRFIPHNSPLAFSPLDDSTEGNGQGQRSIDFLAHAPPPPPAAFADFANPPSHPELSDALATQVHVRGKSRTSTTLSTVASATSTLPPFVAQSPVSSEGVRLATTHSPPSQIVANHRHFFPSSIAINRSGQELPSSPSAAAASTHTHASLSPSASAASAHSPDEQHAHSSHSSSSTEAAEAAVLLMTEPPTIDNGAKDRECEDEDGVTVRHIATLDDAHDSAEQDGDETVRLHPLPHMLVSSTSGRASPNAPNAHSSLGPSSQSSGGRPGTADSSSRGGTGGRKWTRTGSIINTRRRRPAWLIKYSELDVDSHPIGHGGFSLVLKAKWNGDVVAVKRLLNESCTDDDKMEARLLQEAELLHNLKHRNVIQLKAACVDPPNFCMIMEFASLGTLAKHVKTQLDPSRVHDWALQIAKGMHYLHEEAPIPLIHRDLKPANVLVAKGFVMKISDFGLAREHTHTTQLSAAGTYAYMSPEVIRQSKFSKTADVWSFGVLCWNMLTGKIPYAGMEGLAIAYGIATSSLSLPIPEDCPFPFNDILTRSWKKDLKERPSFQSIIWLLELPEATEFAATSAAAFASKRTAWDTAIDEQCDPERATNRITEQQDELVRQLEEQKKRAEELDERERKIAEMEEMFRQQQELQQQQSQSHISASQDAAPSGTGERKGFFTRLLRRRSRPSNSPQAASSTLTEPQIVGQVISPPSGFRHVQHVGAGDAAAFERTIRLQPSLDTDDPDSPDRPYHHQRRRHVRKSRSSSSQHGKRGTSPSAPNSGSGSGAPPPPTPRTQKPLKTPVNVSDFDESEDDDDGWDAGARRTSEDSLASVGDEAATKETSKRKSSAPDDIGTRATTALESQVNPALTLLEQQPAKAVPGSSSKPVGRSSPTRSFFRLRRDSAGKASSNTPSSTSQGMHNSSTASARNAKLEPSSRSKKKKGHFRSRSDMTVSELMKMEASSLQAPDATLNPQQTPSQKSPPCASSSSSRSRLKFNLFRRSDDKARKRSADQASTAPGISETAPAAPAGATQHAREKEPAHVLEDSRSVGQSDMDVWSTEPPTPTMPGTPTTPTPATIAAATEATKTATETETETETETALVFTDFSPRLEHKELLLRAGDQEDPHARQLQVVQDGVQGQPGQDFAPSPLSHLVQQYLAGSRSHQRKRRFSL